MLNTGTLNAVPIRLALALTVFNFIGANAMRMLVTLYVLELGAAPWVVGVVGGLLYLFPLLLSWPIGAMADRVLHLHDGAIARELRNTTPADPATIGW